MQENLFCDVSQVNQLTALLLAHGIHDVVVCPGSRNATIVHNLYATGERMHIHPVTDERSAAFVALGISLATQEPVAVCVTSGSALLNCVPAVAEAYYRHIPLLVISADRPAEWIGQLDGQTLPQVGALVPYCPTFQLNTSQTETAKWANNRRINEAILALRNNGGGPSHINVPIEEPMFSFTTKELPAERVIRAYRPVHPRPLPDAVVQQIREARLPALVIGQYEAGDIRREVNELVSHHQMLVLTEVISDVSYNFLMNSFDELDPSEKDLIPDVIVQIGGNFVHKRFKSLLRQSNCSVIRIGEEREVPDTFCHLETCIASTPQPALAQLAASLPTQHQAVAHATEVLSAKWEEASQKRKSAEPLSPVGIMQNLQQTLSAQSEPYTLHLANSTAVRAAGQIFSAGSFPIYCNRGVNGIEGSLSTAVGCALKQWGLHVLVIGDLSFFYDVNGLWNTQLPSTLRILLLNNRHGGIFDGLPGLEVSPALSEYIAGNNPTCTAEGLSATYGLGYRTVHSADELKEQLAAWIAPADRAQILEVFMN